MPARSKDGGMPTTSGDNSIFTRKSQLFGKEGRKPEDEKQKYCFLETE